MRICTSWMRKSPCSVALPHFHPAAPTDPQPIFQPFRPHTQLSLTLTTTATANFTHVLVLLSTFTFMHTQPTHLSRTLQRNTLPYAKLIGGGSLEAKGALLFRSLSRPPSPYTAFRSALIPQS